MSEKCAGKTWVGWEWRPCTYNGKLNYAGGLWCKIHHPPTLEAKRNQKHSTWENERKLIEARRAIEDARFALSDTAVEYLALWGDCGPRDDLAAERNDMKRCRALHEAMERGAERLRRLRAELEAL